MVFSSRLGVEMASMNSTPVEIVSINYKDLTENFLTCRICLCNYDGGEHTPKLLSCSHTVCLQCLTRIVDSVTIHAISLTCPLCREEITLPRDGVSALPPSFLVNQLLDLIAKQTRTCSSHPGEELLVCENCDCVFCRHSADGPHSDTPCDHTDVYPFSVALKKKSVILMYRANECLSKLDSAGEAVTSEIIRLKASATAANEAIDRHFTELKAELDKRHNELKSDAADAATYKTKLLEEQLELIDVEKAKVEAEYSGVQEQVEVSEVSSRIKAMGARLGGAVKMAEPRENAFLAVDFAHNKALQRFAETLPELGSVRTSTTFPGLCTLQLESFESSRELVVILRTVDCNGEPRSTGGDPVTAAATLDDTPLPCTVTDLDNGLYRISMRPLSLGTVCVHVMVFSRGVRDSPLRLNVPAAVCREFEQTFPTTSVRFKWSAEQEAEASGIVERNSSVKLSQTTINEAVKRAEKRWDIFYTVNENGFFDNYDWFLTQSPVSAFINVLKLIRVFSDNEKSCSVNINIFEIGCGVGNEMFSILQKSQDLNFFLYGCDFSSKAIDIMKQNELYDKKRCQVFVLDATTPEWRVPFAENSQDIIYLYFVLSAIHPKKMPIVIKQIYKYLKPGGRVLFRDYGKYDLDQLSFGKGRCISDNCYLRADNTMVSYFTQEKISNLFESAGFKEQNILIIRKQDSIITNRFKIRIQAEYRKPL